MNTIKMILFDLDGTLLPMDQDEFIAAYFYKLGKKFSDSDQKTFIRAVQYGVAGMLQNDGSSTNEEVFWRYFGQVIPDYSHYEAGFLDFYQHEFQELAELIQPYPHVGQVIKQLKTKGYRIACCTNPLFPQIATYSRIKWLGIEPSEFEWVTTMENSHYSKPQLAYYQEVLDQLQLDPAVCLMVGNDVEEDMGISELGVETYLITNHLINKKNLSITPTHQGTFDDFYQFVLRLPRHE
ncbi:MAG: HAD family hydrolase [Bacilli bacterium]|nr:HAD family hydrolase [Bacilli bacterium]